MAFEMHWLLTVPPSSFSMASALSALVLRLLTAGFAVWCRSRYGETEKRYVIQGIPILACAGILFYIDLRHHTYWSLGIYSVVYFSASLLIGSDSRRKKRSTMERR